MKTLLTFLAFLFFFAPATAQKVLIDATEWELNGSKATFTTHLGLPALRLNDASSSIAMLKRPEFTNGTIEYNVAFTDDTRFTSIHFRRKNNKNSEHFYLRSNAVNNPNVNSAVQYAAIIDGVNLWDISNEYQSNARLKAEGWNHVKLIVRDRQMLAYVNDMETPALYIPIMDGDWASGGIGFEGNVYLANLRVTPDETPGLAPGQGMDPTHNDARYLRNWQVTQPIDLPVGTEPLDLPSAETEWSVIKAERMGMINLSRKFGATARGNRRMVWLKASITTEALTYRQLDFGFSDEVYIYLNGQPLRTDKNLFNTPGMKPPRGRCSIENSRISLPLKAGENTLMVGVTNFFFGWGIVARLDDGGELRY